MHSREERELGEAIRRDSIENREYHERGNIENYGFDRFQSKKVLELVNEIKETVKDSIEELEDMISHHEVLLSIKKDLTYENCEVDCMNLEILITSLKNIVERLRFSSRTYAVHANII